jgi:hypothetical protein
MKPVLIELFHDSELLHLTWAILSHRVILKYKTHYYIKLYGPQDIEEALGCPLLKFDPKQVLELLESHEPSLNF